MFNLPQAYPQNRCGKTNLEKMKKTVIASILMVITALCAAVPSQAQLRFGLKAGIDVNSLHFNSSLFDSDNQTGFTGGVMAEFVAPVVGLGFDISAMYVRRNLDATISEDGEVASAVSHRDYIEIPLNIKYKIGIPALGKVLTPFVTTGPAVAFLTSRTGINDFIENKKVDATWNFGFGVELFSHVQLAASYGLGLSNSVVSKLSGDHLEDIDIDGKTRCWTVTAAWLF